MLIGFRETIRKQMLVVIKEMRVLHKKTDFVDYYKLG